MNNKIYAFAVAALVFFGSCDNRLDQDVELDVTVYSEGSYKEGDVIVVKKSTDIIFNFTGDPDFLTFYSGENGHEYSKRNLTESPVDQITSRLEFYTKNQYGNAATVAGSLRAYLSTEFTGMVKNDKKADSTAIENTNWINITEEGKIPNTINTTSPVASIPLDEYLGQRLTIAFEYHTTNNSAAQPVWEIYDLKVVNTLKDDGSESQILASRMGFTPLDMYVNGNAAYNTVSNNTSGVWNLSNIAAASSPRMRIHSSSAGAVLNRDWLVSNPFVINARTPDSGVGIKNITARLDQYTYKYDKEGTYEVTFIATNSNFESTSEVVRTIYIKVVD